jgi:hypothetical protein
MIIQLIFVTWACRTKDLDLGNDTFLLQFYAYFEVEFD